MDEVGRRIPLNIVLVDPIAATPTITLGSIVRPRVPFLYKDLQLLRETNLVELGSAFADLGHSATVVLGDMYLDDRVWDLSRGLKVVPVNTFMRSPFHPALLPMTPALVGHRALRDADIIQSGEFHQPSTFFACMAAREADIPLVVWQETFAPMQFPGSWYQLIYERTAGRYVRLTTRRYVPRTTKASGYLKELQVDDARITSWIPTGIDLTTFRPSQSDSTPEDLGWKEGDRVLLLVARLHPSKGVDLALHILRRVLRLDRRVRLVVRGSGPELDRLRQLALELGVQEAVHFVGRVSRKKMVHLYRLADLVLCTSRNDLLPFALIEASACGRSCVTTDVGAVRDIVSDGVSGIVIGENGAEGLSRAVLTLLQDDELRATYGNEARKRMETYFDLPKVAERLLEVYRDASS